MRLKSTISGLAAMVLGLSLSPAFAANLLVDNFANMGTFPSNGTNTYSYGPPSGTLGNSRDLTKSNGSAFQWGSAPSQLKMTATGAGNNLHMRYDGNVGTTSNQFFNPRVNASAYSYLNVLAPSVAVQSTTTAVAYITWFNAATGGSQVTSSRTLTGAPTGGYYKFKLSSFTAPITNLSYIGAIEIRLLSLAAGTTTVDSIYFSQNVVPEPGTLALAGLGLVGVVIARRKKAV